MGISIIIFIIGLLILITEMFTGTFALLWLGLGTIITSAVYYFTENTIISFLIFFISIIISIYATKRVRKIEPPVISSGVYSYIGRQLRVLEVDLQDSNRGTVGINGEVWNVLNKDEQLEQGDIVLIKDVLGATLLVVKIKEEK
jgi:membrane protein implicated in regulation of membrane protease activity